MVAPTKSYSKRELRASDEVYLQLYLPERGVGKDMQRSPWRFYITFLIDLLANAALPGSQLDTK